MSENEWGTPPEAEPKDEAYGVKADGSPRRKPGPAKGTPRPPRKTTASSRAPSSKAKPPDYRKGILGIAQLAAAPLAIAGQRSKAFLADAAMVTAYAPPIAEGLQDVSESDPRVAAILDKVLAVGPWSAVLAPVMGLVTQAMVNHNVIPIALGRQLGALEPDELIDAVAKMQGQAAA